MPVYSIEKPSSSLPTQPQSMFISESGKIYSFGANGEGQLGVEDSPSSNVPKCIDSLVIQQYTMLAAGADHSVALSGNDYHSWHVVTIVAHAKPLIYLKTINMYLSKQ